jgi:hypothetical protein
MTELAYMVRESWAQHGTSMVPQSGVIRKWLGGAPYLFAVKDVRDFGSGSRRGADFETAQFIDPDAKTRKVFSIGELARLPRKSLGVDHAIVVLRPYEQKDLEALGEAMKAGSLARVFVMIWSPRDVVRTWLDGVGALDLHTGAALATPDPVMVEAGKSLVNEEYNGLASGRGKDAVVQLVRAFTAAGYPLELDAWLRAYFAAGGTFGHAEEIAKLVGEMKRGVRHRVKPRYRDNIVDILRERADANAS